MAKKINRDMARKRRRLSIRNKLSGSEAVPRMSVFRSLNNIYVQIINDETGKTLVSASTNNGEIRSKIKKGGNVEAATIIGKEIADKAKKANITKVVFDRGGCKYHGRIKAVAEAAREEGLII